MRCALLGQCWQPHLSILRMAGTKELNFLILIPQFVQFPNHFLHSCLSSYRSQDKSLLACFKKKHNTSILTHTQYACAQVLSCVQLFGTPWINTYTLETETVSHIRLCDPVDCSLPGSSVHGISQARILEQVAIFYFRGSSWLRTRTPVSWVSCIGR